MSENQNLKPDEGIRRGQFAEKEGEVILREHEYDGIQEYDQKLPNWWLYTFYGAIVFFVGLWFVYYQTGWMRSPRQLIVDEMTEVQMKKNVEMEAAMKTLNDDVLVNKWSKDEGVVAAGRATYMANCTACHGADLAAKNLPGRPLNDHVWHYSDKPMEIFKLINEGSPKDSAGFNGAKMQVWGQSLTPKQIAEIVAFLIHENPSDFKKFEK